MWAAYMLGDGPSLPRWSDDEGQPTASDAGDRHYSCRMTGIEHCPGCPYREFGPAVGSRGDPAGRVVIVGEAPGKQEILQGRPFVGPAGRILRTSLSKARLVEADLFITNSIACLPHPVHPRVTAINACRGRLQSELQSYHRDVIVALGATALRALTGQRAVRVLDARKLPPTETPWELVVATVHPARVLRRPAEIEFLVDDLVAARRLAVNAGASASPRAAQEEGA
jgi:DNA polymerase